MSPLQPLNGISKVCKDCHWGLDQSFLHGNDQVLHSHYLSPFFVVITEREITNKEHDYPRALITLFPLTLRVSLSLVFNNNQILLVNISFLCLCLRSFSLAQNYCFCAYACVASDNQALLFVP